MNGINARVGARIRLYRRAKKLTLIQLSAMIHKSKATLSKYETGDIAIDVETLYDIAAALDIRMEQLLDQRTFSRGEAHGESCAFFQQSRIYVYFYDGRIGRCVKNVLQLDRATEPCTAVFYLDVPSFDDDALLPLALLRHGRVFRCGNKLFAGQPNQPHGACLALRREPDRPRRAGAGHADWHFTLPNAAGKP